MWVSHTTTKFPAASDATDGDSCAPWIVVLTWNSAPAGTGDADALDGRRSAQAIPMGRHPLMDGAYHRRAAAGKATRERTVIVWGRCRRVPTSGHGADYGASFEK